MQYVNFTDPAVGSLSPASPMPKPSLTQSQLPRYYKASFFEYVNAFKVYGSEA